MEIENPGTGMPESGVPSQPVELKPRTNRVFSLARTFALFIILIAIVIASFRISFYLGKKVLFQAKKPELKPISAPIPEAPPSIKAMQKLQEEMAKETAKLPRAEKKVPVKPAPAPKTAAPRAVRTARLGTYYKVQVGRIADKITANQLGEEVLGDGFDVYIKKVSGGYRVQAGAFRKKTEADALAARLTAKGYQPRVIFE
ncbi:MAG: SPOR domain-containing protein [Candidatus Margulisbacteria bacterium]|nr:SPOR domain-containing protein [Candidatus Margulisiibacteriota bacterium]